MFPLLILHMKENLSEFFIVMPETISDQDMFSNVLKKTNCPLLVVKGSSIFDEQGDYCVVIRGMVKIEVSDFVEGMLVVLMSYFVFNIQYPTIGERTLEFMQRFFLKVNPRSQKRREKQKKTTVNPAVTKLAGALKDHEALQSRWALQG